MVKRIALIDCAIVDPVVPCLNKFMIRTGQAVTYHLPAKFGVADLQEREDLSAVMILWQRLFRE